MNWRGSQVDNRNPYTNKTVPSWCIEALGYFVVVVQLRHVVYVQCIPWNMHTVHFLCFHYSYVIMGAIASKLTSLTIVYSTVYSGANQRQHQSSASIALCGEFTVDRWIPRTNGQLRRKCFHLMTSSCRCELVLADKTRVLQGFFRHQFLGNHKIVPVAVKLTWCYFYLHHTMR